MEYSRRDECGLIEMSNKEKLSGYSVTTKMLGAGTTLFCFIHAHGFTQLG